MNENFAIQLFEGKKVRIVWDAEQEKYYFSVTDIVQVLTDSVNPRDYIKKMLRRDPELKSKWGTICPPVEMLAPDGKRRKTQAADLEGIFRIIQAIPSKKAEPVKQWLAELGSMRVDQMIDPELTFQMAVEDYRRQGYSDRWINERMRSIEMRKELTDEWHRSGIHEPKDFAILTNVLTKAWSGMTKGEGLFWVMPVEKVASQICAAIRKRKSKVYVTKRWHVLAIINKNLPFTLYKRM